MKKPIGVFVLALCSMLLATCFPAQAQQPGKIFRIGFLDPSTASGMAVMVDAFREGLRDLGYIEGKTSPSSIGLQRAKAISA